MTTRLSDPSAEIICGSTLATDQQALAVDIIYEAFQKKICKLLLLTDSPQQAKRILLQVIDFSQSLIFIRGQQVCGVMLMNCGIQDCFRFDWTVARREFGIWGSIYRRLNYFIVVTKSKLATELTIHSLAVRAGDRSQGIGSALLQAAESYAELHGYALLSLEVVDTNPRARKLYEQKGFIADRKTSTWPYTRRAGFNGYSHMIKRLELS